MKWFGHFSLEWVFLRDVKNNKLKHIKSDVKAVIYLTDGKSVKYDKGIKFLRSFGQQPEKPNIFEDFKYMDKRELELRKVRETPQFHQEFQKYSYSYRQNPSQFRDYLKQKKQFA